jgi:hypothetical protein
MENRRGVVGWHIRRTAGGAEREVREQSSEAGSNEMKKKKEGKTRR